MDDSKLVELTQEGYEEIGNYAGWKILAKETDRILYDPKTDKVDFTYESNHNSDL